MAQPLKPGLRAEHVQHPLDRSAMQALFERMTRSIARKQITALMREVEEEFYVLNLADNTRLTEQQGGSVYRLVRETAATLGMPVPVVFLDTSTSLNPRTLGGENPSIVLTSELVDGLSDRPLRAVIGRELGHIFCGHSFYRLLTENYDHVAQLAQAVPVVGALLSLGLRLVLMDWYRKSALSADRVALLGTQDLEGVEQSILWFAGGSTRIGSELSLDGFRAQASEFEATVASKRAGTVVERMGYYLSGIALEEALNAHPFPATRLVEISSWADSDSYRRILAGEYDAVEAAPGPEDSRGEEEPAADAPDGAAGALSSLGRYAARTFKSMLQREEGGSEPEQPSA